MDQEPIFVYFSLIWPLSAYKSTFSVAFIQVQVYCTAHTVYSGQPLITNILAQS